MALITKLDRRDLMNPQRGRETEALYCVIDDFEERYVQIDTFGSKNRKYPNKVSQSIRVNKEIAEKLVAILKEAFDIE